MMWIPSPVAACAGMPACAQMDPKGCNTPALVDGSQDAAVVRRLGGIWRSGLLGAARDGSGLGCALAWLRARETTSGAECGCSRRPCVSRGWGGGGPPASSQPGLSAEISIFQFFHVGRFWGSKSWEAPFTHTRRAACSFVRRTPAGCFGQLAGVSEVFRPLPHRKASGGFCSFTGRKN